MNQPESLIEILRRAREGQAAEPGDARERNLRRLIRAAMPAPEVSEDLRQRVQALAAEPPRGGRAARERAAGGRGLLHWARAMLSPRSSWRTAALAFCCALLVILLTTGRSASALARTLNAMAAVRSAHCIGWFFSYTDMRPDGSIIPVRMREEWWYKAPDRYRREIGPEYWGTSTEPGVLIVKGQEGIFTSSHHATRGEKTRFTRAELTQDLSPFDFFSTEGIIQRAERENRAQVVDHAGLYRGRRVRVLTVQYRRGISKYDWILYVDPSSRLILAAQASWYCRIGRGWKLQSQDRLDEFVYNTRVPHELF